MTNANKQRNTVVIVTMYFILMMISFITNMASPLGNIWGYKYEWAGMMGNMMNFAAYLVMGIPAGRMLIKLGYRLTAQIGLFVGAVGLFVQYLSSIFGDSTVAFSMDSGDVCWNLIIYLIGALISGFSMCMLNTVVNPTLKLSAADPRKANQIMQAGATLNSLTGTLSPYLVGAMIGTVSKETSMADVTPLLWIGIGIFILALIVVIISKMPEPQGDLRETKFERSPWAFRHCTLGVIAIFFYVGMEIGIQGEMNFYITRLGFENSAAIAGKFVAAYWLLMLCGRFVSTLISNKVSPQRQLAAVAIVAIGFLLIAIFMPEDITISFATGDVPTKCVFITLCGLCTSIMWACIYNLATEGLGKYTPAASGIFMMMVVGGGIMPLIQDYIGRTFDYISSYWLIIAMLVYILFYSLKGCKNVNTDIDVSL
ncbi:MAG: MFS transporter [Bacteroidales bacterium]|nr:MFS transporter [Bacteroidales bacterium]